ncbi:MAG TPA: hypothetical protein VIN09_09030 [Chloroflexota bacterium]
MVAMGVVGGPAVSPRGDLVVLLQTEDGARSLEVEVNGLRDPVRAADVVERLRRHAVAIVLKPCPRSEAEAEGLHLHATILLDRHGEPETVDTCACIAIGCALRTGLPVEVEDEVFRQCAAARPAIAASQEPAPLNLSPQVRAFLDTLRGLDDL